MNAPHFALLAVSIATCRRRWCFALDLKRAGTWRDHLHRQSAWYGEAGQRWTATQSHRPDASALGGLRSPAGSCVWHVVGLQRSVREWAMRQGWGGKPVRVERAQGILVAGLGVLAGLHGYSSR
jgi:hypothetical protein